MNFLLSLIPSRSIIYSFLPIIQPASLSLFSARGRKEEREDRKRP
jgi:hypothetical protein